MGQEVACTLKLGKRALTGTAYLEGDHILFRGEERVKIVLKDVTGAKAADGVLKLNYPGGPAAIELGAAAAKWEQKILHPPTRLSKLGVKAGLRISLSGKFDEDFVRELGEVHHRPVKNSDLIFLAADDLAALEKATSLIPYLAPAGGLWVVYPKGVKTIRDTDVFRVVRATGLKDNKVASFSATHTALRFVIPLAARR